MRILFFLNNVSKTRHFESVIAALAERGHTLVLAAGRQRNRPLSLPKTLTLVNHSLIAQRKPGRIEITACPVRRVDAWENLAPALRRARDYLRFFDPRYAQAAKLEQRSAVQAPAGWPEFLDSHPRISRQWPLIARMLALAEHAIPCDPLFDLFIKYEQPDLVLVTPLVDYGSYQTDYVKSAHRLGIPVVFAPFSWDNLTNRGLIRVPPDRMLVWNEIQKKEAVELHGVDAERIHVTGASRFDEFFAMRPSSTREVFCARNGLDPAFPSVLYVCSSEFVAPREVEFVERWVRTIRASSDPAVRDVSVLVRPHPAHLKQWRHVDLSAIPRVVVWSEKETMNADQGLYDSLYHCSAVVGLNTSAMIEAGILGKRVLTVVSEEFSGGQEQTLHFHYLRASNGGLLHEARGLDEHVAQLAEAIKSEGPDEQSRRFVQRFVRPCGLHQAVTPVLVDEIERAGAIDKRRARSTPWHYVARWGISSAWRLKRALPGAYVH